MQCNLQQYSCTQAHTLATSTWLAGWFTNIFTATSGDCWITIRNSSHRKDAKTADTVTAEQNQRNIILSEQLGYFLRPVFERVTAARVQTDLVALVTTRPTGGNESDSLSTSSLMADTSGPPAQTPHTTYMTTMQPGLRVTDFGRVGSGWVFLLWRTFYRVTPTQQTSEFTFYDHLVLYLTAMPVILTYVLIVLV